MKLLLLNPCRTQRQFSYPSSLWHLASAVAPQPRLGLERLAGVEVDLAKVLCQSDYWAARNSKVVLARHQPDAVGIGVYDSDLDMAAALCKAMHAHRPELTIIVGGPFATKLPRTALAETGADVVMRGEVDFTLREALTRLRDGQPLLGLDGVLTRDRDGVIHDCPASARVPVVKPDELERLELDREFLARTFDRSEYRFLSLVASRGCAYGCSFCNVNVSQRLRSVSDDRVLELIRTYGSDYDLSITDPLFGGHRKGMLRLLERKRAELPHVLIGGNFSVDQLVEDGPRGRRVPSRAAIELLVAAGIRQVELGIESFSDAMLERLKARRYTGHEAAAVVEAVAEAGLAQTIDIILTDFRCTAEELRASLATLFATAVRVAGRGADKGPGLHFVLNDKVLPFAGTAYYRELLSSRSDDDWRNERTRARPSLDPEFPWFALDYELHEGPREYLARGGVVATGRLLRQIGADPRLARRLQEHGYGDDSPAGRAAWLAERLIAGEGERVLAGLDDLSGFGDSQAIQECRRKGFAPLALAAAG